MLTATDAFMCSLENWLKAVRADGFDMARNHATHLVKAGELLAIHADFVRAFAQHFPDVSPRMRCCICANSWCPPPMAVPAS
jgi:hypothetical protein